ncbi:MAG: hypothetical protein NT132_00960 [Microbacterium sp.]|uniref:NADH-ubiquinone oxidoreductase-F iron-sulfur binding region domain-containing protein n=1 Tax=Microbacterium sp. TaxID=51671 RepID=UPI002623B739|nr:NADH-ubiquinone oxidoreductase-F iron-sulfur binding region domain-containing protein [Microbacterium sp.]MCX6500986.1 hypothetical protein [Microbacterium sp.]
MINTQPSVPRLLAAPSPSLHDHSRTFGPRPSPSAAELIGELERAGLDGRGGAGFPAHRKLHAVAAQPRKRGARIVIGNGSEGEPLSAKDAVLLASAPHLVIDGLLICADALGATEARLVVGPSTAGVVRAALAERSDAHAIRLHAESGGFVGGEASAVVAGLAGRRPVPADRPVRLAVSGLHRRPTLVQNVETLAHIALIARYGAAWHRSVGTTDAPGTRLVSVSWGDTSPRVFEVSGGSPLRSLLDAAGAPVTFPALVGGFHGAWVPASALDAPLSASGLAPHGASPGAGILHPLAEDACGIQVTARTLATLAAASAGQCGPCANGLPRIAQLMRELLAGADTTAELRRIAGLIDGRGACHHPDGTVRMLRSALVVFADDIAAHAHGRCLTRSEVRA